MTDASGRYDVLILGGGPAGTAAAICLCRQGLTVAILERSTFDHPRVGEMLPPEASRWLRDLDVWPAFERAGHLASPGILCAWNQEVPDEADSLFNPFGSGWHLDRVQFDMMLAQAAEQAGATVLRSVRIHECQRIQARSWRASFTHADQVCCWTSSFLIDATGRSAWAARRQGVRRVACDQLVGVGGVHSRVPEATQDDPRLLIEAMEHGWWYSGLLPDQRAITVWMTDAEDLPHRPDALRRLWEGRLSEAPLTAARARGWGSVDALRTVPANTARLEIACGPSWVAVGDAAASFDPLSSRGISTALESGIRAAHVVPQVLGGGRPGPLGDVLEPLSNRLEPLSEYAMWLDDEFATYQQHYAYYYGAVTRWPESPFWQRRHHAPSEELIAAS